MVKISKLLTTAGASGLTAGQVSPCFNTQALVRGVISPSGCWNYITKQD